MQFISPSGEASSSVGAMIAGLAEAKEVAGNNPEAKAEYRRLREKVADHLVPRMADDEKAKEAYRALSALETGR